MAPNKECMHLIHDQLDNAYIIGIENFLNNAFTRMRETQKICCPCVKCYSASTKYMRWLGNIY